MKKIGRWIGIWLAVLVIGIAGFLIVPRLGRKTSGDAVTGMENLRSMVGSLRRYMALSERNGTSMGLMMVRLRYAEEIKKIRI